mmetsp:Transcript_689/g.1855  ORF Transcript_689/g.1855 Transcript_689/m.1855 type:complete len:321 (+) Transcript_689:87-1049(+)
MHAGNLAAHAGPPQPLPGHALNTRHATHIFVHGHLQPILCWSLPILLLELRWSRRLRRPRPRSVVNGIGPVRASRSSWSLRAGVLATHVAVAHRRRHEVGLALHIGVIVVVHWDGHIARTTPLQLGALFQSVLSDCCVPRIQEDHLRGSAVRTEAQVNVLVHSRHVLLPHVVCDLASLVKELLVRALVPELLQRFLQEERHGALLVSLETGIQCRLATERRSEGETSHTRIHRHSAVRSTSSRRNSFTNGRVERHSWHAARPRVSVFVLPPHFFSSTHHLLRSRTRLPDLWRTLHGIDPAGHVKHIRRMTCIQDHCEEGS